MKKILILVVLLLVAGGGYWYFIQMSGGPAVFDEGPGQVPVAKQDTEKFSGKIQEVNTGCFADAECYVVVEGKHVTVLMGRTMGPVVVGNIIGVPTIGELEDKIGAEVEVYAQRNGDGTYTLHGSHDYYIKLK